MGLGFHGDSPPPRGPRSVSPVQKVTQHSVTDARSVCINPEFLSSTDCGTQWGRLCYCVSECNPTASEARPQPVIDLHNATWRLVYLGLCTLPELVCPQLVQARADSNQPVSLHKDKVHQLWQIDLLNNNPHPPTPSSKHAKTKLHNDPDDTWIQ